MAGGGAPVGRGNADMQSVPNLMTFVSIFVVMMGAGMFGADQNNYGVTYGLTSFQEHWCPSFNFTGKELIDEDLTQHSCSDIAAMKQQPAAWRTFITWGLNLVTLGMCAGACTMGPLLSALLGRRMTISIAGATCFFGTAIVAWLSGSSVTIYNIGRFVTGFGCGMACMVLPMYNSEVATQNIRGLTGSLFQFMVVVGGVVAILALTGVKKNWGQGFLIPGYFGIVVGVGVWLCPESPRYLMERKGPEAARAALQRVRKGDVTEEMEFMATCLEEERAAGKVGWAELFTTPGLRYRLFVACYLQAAQQFTGVNAFLGFQTDIFGAAGYKPEDINTFPFGPAMIVQWVFVIGSVTGLLLVDSPFGGRKKQLLGAAVFMGPPLLIAAITNKGNPRITAYMVYIFSFGFQAAWGIIPWFYPAELFQMKERERALAVSTLCGFGCNFFVGMVTKALFNWSQGGMFLIFGILNVTNCVFVTICIKETKGLELEAIPALFGPVGGRNVASQVGISATNVTPLKAGD